MQKRLTRSEVPVELTWDLTDIFGSVEEWESEFNAVAGMVDTVTKFKGRLGEGAKVLLDCLLAQEALQKRLAKVTAYASLNNSSDGTNPAFQAMAGKAGGLMASIQSQTSFIQSEALALPEGTLQKYLDEEPGLEPFRVTIERMIESKPHLLQPESEMILAALSEVLESPARIYERSRAADIPWEPVEDSKATRCP